MKTQILRNMTTSNTNKTTKMIFPRNSGFVISEILKKHKINETKKQILQKIKTGEETLARKIAKIVRQIAEGTLSDEIIIQALRDGVRKGHLIKKLMLGLDVSEEIRHQLAIFLEQI